MPPSCTETAARTTGSRLRRRGLLEIFLQIPPFRSGLPPEMDSINVAMALLKGLRSVSSQ